MDPCSATRGARRARYTVGMTPASTRTPGSLVDDAHAHGFAYRLLEPCAEAPASLVVLLHGVGGDETQLAEVAARLPAHAAVALARGPRTLGGERLGWFRVGLASDPPEIVEDEAEDARLRLATLIAHLQSKFDVAPARTWLAGFSQGGELAASAALTMPDRVAGFAVVCGRILPEIEARIAPPAALRHLRALVVHGRDDDVLPVRWAEETSAWLDRLGIAHALRLHDAGHELAPALRDDLARWLRAAAS